MSFTIWHEKVCRNTLCQQCKIRWILDTVHVYWHVYIFSSFAMFLAYNRVGEPSVRTLRFSLSAECGIALCVKSPPCSTPCFALLLERRNENIYNNNYNIHERESNPQLSRLQSHACATEQPSSMACTCDSTLNIKILWKFTIPYKILLPHYEIFNSRHKKYSVVTLTRLWTTFTLTVNYVYLLITLASLVK